MSEIKSSGIAALGPVSGIHATNLLGAPIGSPIDSLELGAGAPIGSPIESLELGADAPVESPTYLGAPAPTPYY